MVYQKLKAKTCKLDPPFSYTNSWAFQRMLTAKTGVGGRQAYFLFLMCALSGRKKHLQDEVFCL